MKPETLQFIESLFKFYEQSSSGNEPENAKALNDAWDDLEAYKIRQDKDRKTVAELFAVIDNESRIGLWELGATFIEILMKNK